MRIDRCFAFLDLCGFTSYTESNGDEEAVSVLAMMRSVVRRAVERRGVAVNKWLGDGVMLSSPTKASVAAATLEIRHHLGGASPLVVRAGIARGDVITFEGDDYVGSAINLASRLCDLAQPDQILLAGSPDATVPVWATTHRHGPVAVAGLVQPVDVLTVDFLRTPGTVPVIDPLCGVPIDPSVAVAPQGETNEALRCFCSESCAEQWGRARSRRVRSAV